ncbi:hypothetical protein Tco_1301085 [Tanacetum coccineum]
MTPYPYDKYLGNECIKDEGEKDGTGSADGGWLFIQGNEWRSSSLRMNGKDSGVIHFGVKVYSREEVASKFQEGFWRHLDDLEMIWKLFISFGGNSEKARARTHVFLNKDQDLHTGDIDAVEITTRRRLKIISDTI